MSDPDMDRDPEMAELLSQLRQDPPPGEFGAELHRRLVQAGPPPPTGLWVQAGDWLRQHPLWSGGLAGAVTGVSVFMLLQSSVPDVGQDGRADVAAPRPMAVAPIEAEPPPGLEVDEAGEGIAEVQVFVVPVNMVAMVQLNFHTATAVDEAEFSVILPEGLSFFSGGEALDERSFHWRAPLEAGDNAVPVAVVSDVPGRYRLTATAVVAGELVAHEVVLEIEEAS